MKNGKQNYGVSSKITSSHALENGMDSIFTQLQNWSNITVLKKGILFRTWDLLPAINAFYSKL